ncbi:MAG: 2OG-Fe(II) oxygenase [Legionellales bacterium]|nr:2OG-Fe(II) oxygenase [Legionellales bacterium]
MNLRQILTKKILETSIVNEPFDHIIIDDFCPIEIAKKLAAEFGNYEVDYEHKYSNSLEEKRTCNQWNLFPETTYSYFQCICSEEISRALSKKFNITIEADHGLHGGGRHIYSKMGNLNPHLDYAIHPKIGMERRLNAIYYLTDEYEEEDGGHLGLWDNSSSEKPGSLIKEYAPLFNRLVVFNSSQNSWHGLSRIYSPSGDRFRKSLATYYVSEPRNAALANTRALFAPREEQLGDSKILEEIKLRVNEKNHKQAYITKK